MSQSSPILGLPFLQPSQAQKHVTHNEALRRLDPIVQLRVVEIGATTPPETPAPNAVFALGTGATGVWAGQDNTLAVWSSAGWSFVTPLEGWRAWDLSARELRVWDGSAWASLVPGTEQLAGVGIGTSSDTTNKLSVSADATLLSHAGAGHQVKINKSDISDTASLLFQSNWSGRAELGLVGQDAFSIKVSNNGTDWTEALLFDGTSGIASGDSIQSSPTDSAPGKLLATGAFGLGEASAIRLSDVDGHKASGFYYGFCGLHGLATPGANPFPSDGGAFGLLHLASDLGSDDAYQFQLATVLNPNNDRTAIRSKTTGAWSSWTPLVTQDSIVGQVSQANGKPTGAIIEKGANANGQYVRFADGTQICTNSDAPVSTAPAAFVGPITKSSDQKIWFGSWY